MNKFLCYLFFLAFLAGACSEDGLQGPEGPRGEQGEIGPAGEDGSVLLSGIGVPNISLGKNGDYYLNRQNGDFYGPKIENNWGNPIPLKGKDGTNGTNGINGTNGSKILSGTTSPQSNIGSLGDFFLDKSTFQLYGPKTDAGWGVGLLLRGAQGIQGPVGPAGADGSIIYSGNGLPSTTLGKAGDYYLNKLNGDFYGPKVGNAWGTPFSLKGKDGTNGTNGINGTNGVNGKNGNTIWSGAGQPSASLGLNGDFYFETQNYLLYGPKTNSVWGAGILLRGAQGIQGPTGPPGADGSVIYGGNGAPAPQLGKNNDLYFDKQNILMYGPKTSSGWGTGVSLKGSNGTSGTNGNTILNGTTAPAASLGNTGDFYINTSIYEIYGPKSLTNGWGRPTSLKAPGGTGSNAVALETGSDVQLIWGYEVGDINCLRKHDVTNYNDSTSRFYIPDEYVALAKSGSIQVYLGVNTSSAGINVSGPEPNKWIQLNYADEHPDGNIKLFYHFHIVENTAYVRVLGNLQFNATRNLYTVQKVRLVLIPATPVTQILKVPNNGIPLKQTMQTLGISEKDVKKF